GDDIGGADGEQAHDTVILSEGAGEEEEGAAHQQRLEVVQQRDGDDSGGADGEQAIDTVLLSGGSEEEEEGAARHEGLEVVQPQEGDDIGGADGEQAAIDTVLLSGSSEEEEEEEVAAHQQRLEVVQWQQGANIGDAVDNTKPIPMRPYPVAGDDTGTGDPTTPEGDNNGKDEQIGHHAATASASTPQAAEDFVETIVGGSDGGYSPNLSSQSGIKALENEAPTELDGDSTSRGSPIGGVPATSPILLSTPPVPLGDRGAVASASPPQATDDSVGVSVGGSGRAHTPHLPSPSGRELL
ncbi:unnamed protein product, partial [Ectocarpus fasciculatus]